MLHISLKDKENCCSFQAGECILYILKDKKITTRLFCILLPYGLPPRLEWWSGFVKVFWAHKIHIWKLLGTGSWEHLPASQSPATLISHLNTNNEGNLQWALSRNKVKVFQLSKGLPTSCLDLVVRKMENIPFKA